jgi:sugar-specific transcriptional regulator TrmB
MDATELEKLGLNKSEAKVYLALLELGSSTSGVITDKAQVSPSKIYWILEKLLQKGLVSYMIKGKTKHYTAASPGKLKEYLEYEKESIERKEELLEGLLPRLQRVQKLAGERQEAEMFVGFPAMKNAYSTMYDSAKEGDEHLVFLRSGEEEGKPEAVLFFNRLHKRAMKLGLKRRLISRDTQAARELFKKGPYVNRKGDNVRFMDICPEGINVLNDYVLFMHLAEKPICVLITSKQLANDYRKLFDESWKQAKS